MNPQDDTITISNQMPNPANSQYVPLMDSTYWCADGFWTSTATLPGPGKSRGQLGGRRITGFVKPVAQSVTLSFYICTNPSATDNTAFELDTNVSGTSGTGSVTVASGNSQPFSWLPSTPDWRITVLAGATHPTSISSAVVVSPLRTSGV